MTVNNLSGPLYLAHLTAAAGGSSSSPGAVVNYSTLRTPTGSARRIRVTSWPTTGAFGKASALRFSLRNASGSTISNSVQINRGDTGWHTFSLTGGQALTPFAVSGRALGACLYSTPGGQVSDPTGDLFTWHGQIEF